MKHPSSHKQTERRCAVTGCTAASAFLLGFVAAPSGKVVADWKENLPAEHRIYLAAQSSVLREAIARQIFSGLGTHVVADEALLKQVENQWKERMLSLLSLCKRSGAIVMGFEKCKAAIASKRAQMLVQACDGAEDGRNKLSKLAFHHDVFVWERFEKADLAQVTGMANQTHIVLNYGGLTTKFKEEARNFELFIEK